MESAHTTNVAERWARFARNETPRHSPVMRAWAAGVSEDPEVLALIEELPTRERQPNLVIAAARLLVPDLVDPHQLEPRPDEYARLRGVLLERWDEVRRITATRHTQTNEPARLAVMLPALAALHQQSGRELAIIELGASAGLALHPQHWRFRYLSRSGEVLSEFGIPQPGPGQEVAVTIKSHEDAPDRDQVPPVPLPQDLPPVQWRLGVDLNPLNPAHPDDANWLRTLVWPGQAERLERLETALRAGVEDPVLVLQRDITHSAVLDEILALVPTDYLPVVVHGAVMAYLEDADREALEARLLDKVQGGQLHWLSNEGHSVVPGIRAEIARRPEFERRLRAGAFVVALDGVPLYQADGHASWLL
ncbi:DUF2332 domain-containing protein [Aestuariimicrobium sp. p3-SID1156]|uniref:DUF2332 domain-containing protein n=1 Tax=Aestuariimicrobium sp. p3-SID1156 TaxID=2916038 RepID=UPI00223BE36B|nr:DUF2332 domain-containing protein [Aestuariimicrobium sp. p3-SID1156]MCT1458020.1 DUF2332 domain-containing protein [Aestuariimicrobium sp. p3-SID1156]